MQGNDFNGAMAEFAERCCRTGAEFFEHSEDFTMPDYIPDIRRVVFYEVDAKARKLSCGDGRVEWACELCYTALLLCEDDSLHNVVLQGHSEGEMKVEGDCDTAFIEARVEGSGMRALNSRRINGRCRVCVSAQAPCRVSLLPSVSDVQGAQAYFERKCKRVGYCTTQRSECRDRRVSEDIELDASMPEISDIVYCDVCPHLNAVTIKDKTLELRGEAAVDILYTAQDGLHFSKSVALPISASVDLPHESPRASFAKAFIGEVKAAAQSNAYGENKVIELDFSWGADIVSVIDRECEVTGDLYSTVHEVKSSSRDIVLDRYVGCFSGNLSLNGEAECEELSSAEIEKVDCCRGRVAVDEVGRGPNGRIYIAGRAELAVVCTAVGERAGSIACEIKLPFKYERDIDPEGDDFACEYSVAISSLKARADRDRLAVSCELAIGGMVTAAFCESRVEEVEILGELSHRRAPMTLCFNTSGQDLWSIAKRYKVTPAEILGRNRIDEDELASKRVLVIPAAHKAPLFSAVI